MRWKYVFFAVTFLLVTGPGAVEAWLSLLDRFAEGSESVNVSLGNWYQAAFPFLGLAVLLFGIWWTRDRGTASPPPLGLTESTGGSGQLTSNAPAGDEAQTPERPTTDAAPVPIASPFDGGEPLTPAYLLGLIEGRTTAAGNERVAGYIGRRMVVSGTLNDVNKNPITGTTAALEVRSVTVIATFSGDWYERLSAYQLGESITIAGQFGGVLAKMGISLEKCTIEVP